MVFIGAATEARLREAARRRLGADGDRVLAETATATFRVALRHLTYEQLPDLFSAVERNLDGNGDTERAAALARALRALQRDTEANLGSRLVGIAAKVLGPSAEALLDHTCARLNFALGTVDQRRLLVLADAVAEHAAPFLGAEMAGTLADSLRTAGSSLSASVLAEVDALAVEYLGPDGDLLIRQICRERLEMEIETLSIDGLSHLGRAVEQGAPVRFTQERVQDFLAAVRLAVSSPAESLRRQITEITAEAVGPLAGELLREQCAEHGLPWEAVDHEHLMWLAELLRTEVTPLAGKQAADDLARNLRGVLTGRR